MKILHIDPTTQNINDFNNDISKNNNPAFVLYYMVGCGPCEMTRPEWKKIEDILGQDIKESDIIIADINQDVLQNSDLKPKYLTEQNISINGFPTIHYISEKGDLVEEYEGQRTAESFKKWIESKSHPSNKKHLSSGGGSKSRKGKYNKRKTQSKKHKRVRKTKKHKRTHKSKKHRK
jgi:hypothetical protein